MISGSSSSCSSSISPTMISTISSNETRPSVPPYSSMTRAIWVRAACMRAIRSEASMEGGTNSTLRIKFNSPIDFARSTLDNSSGAGRPGDFRRASSSSRQSRNVAHDVADVYHATRIVERLRIDGHAECPDFSNSPIRSPSVVRSRPPRRQHAKSSHPRRALRAGAGCCSASSLAGRKGLPVGVAFSQRIGKVLAQA